MLGWLCQRELDVLLPGAIEQVIPAHSALEDTVHTIMTDAALDSDADAPGTAASRR